MASHEQTHVDQLKDVLGSKAVSAPEVSFGAAVTDQSTFLKTAACSSPSASPPTPVPGRTSRASRSCARRSRSTRSRPTTPAWASTLLKLKRIDTTVSPAPFANNPVFGYRRTLQVVGDTGFVKGL